MANTTFSPSDKEDNGSCNTLFELLQMLAGGESMNGRMANWRILMQAAQCIKDSTPADDAAVCASLDAAAGRR
jgi:hypothetical protein